MSVVWLASYPRSGNTLLRTILWHCFGLRSASIYADDLGGNRSLQEYIGHIEHGPGNHIEFPDDAIPLVKTHGHPPDSNPAIYIVRDGRAASVSMWKFYSGELPLEEIIEGQHEVGTWSSHVRAWNPRERPNTLLLKYEDMTSDLPGVLEKISGSLRRDIVHATIPDRDAIAHSAGRWVRTASEWRSEIPSALLERFNQINGDVLREMGYE